MQTSQLQKGVVVSQSTQGDSDSFVPDGSLGLAKFSTSSILALMGYDAVVGVTLGGAIQYTSIQAAHDALSANARILVTPGVYTETVTISKNLFIVAQGFGCQITGNTTIAATSDYGTLKGIRFNGNLTFAAGAVGNYVNECWQASGFSITEGTVGDNVINVWQE